MKRPSAKTIGLTSSALFLVAAFSATFAFSQLRSRVRGSPTGESVMFLHAGQDREYRIHIPRSIHRNQPVPLVVCLHGGGGNSEQGSRMGLTPVADQYGFIVVYPNAIEKHWNDGRNSPMFAKHDNSIDDVAFIRAVVERVCEEYPIDRHRIFAVGLSNGGFMTQRLAIDCSGLFSAAGIVIASMGEPLKTNFRPKLPVSVLYMNGTADPLIPYAGGPVTVNLLPQINKLRWKPTAPRGRCIATDDAVSLWVERNGISDEPTVTMLENRDPEDGSTVERSLWTDGERGTAVALYKVIGGGHTIPGGIPYLPERIIGKTNQDIDGFEVIWDFFATHARHRR